MRDDELLLEARRIKEDPTWTINATRTVNVFTGIRWEDVEYEEPDAIEMLNFVGWSDDE